jgi:hypothetical protein
MDGWMAVLTCRIYEREREKRHIVCYKEGEVRLGKTKHKWEGIERLGDWIRLEDNI